MKAIHKITKLVVIFAIALIAISCDNSAEDGLYNGENQQTVDAKIVNLTVLVNDTFDGKFLYKIEIFNTDPTQQNAVILKSGVGSRDLFFNSTVSVPEFQKTLFVRQTDPSKIKTVKTIDVTVLNGSVTVDFSK